MAVGARTPLLTALPATGPADKTHFLKKTRDTTEHRNGKSGGPWSKRLQWIRYRRGCGMTGMTGADIWGYFCSQLFSSVLQVYTFVFLHGWDSSGKTISIEKSTVLQGGSPEKDNRKKGQPTLELVKKKINKINPNHYHWLVNISWIAEDQKWLMFNTLCICEDNHIKLKAYCVWKSAWELLPHM